MPGVCRRGRKLLLRLVGCWFMLGLLALPASSRGAIKSGSLSVVVGPLLSKTATDEIYEATVTWSWSYESQLLFGATAAVGHSIKTGTYIPPTSPIAAQNNGSGRIDWFGTNGGLTARTWDSTNGNGNDLDGVHVGGSKTATGVQIVSASGSYRLRLSKYALLTPPGSSSPVKTPVDQLYLTVENTGLGYMQNTEEPIGESLAAFAPIVWPGSALPSVSVSVAPLSVVEDGANNLIFTFTRTGSTVAPLTVNFSVGGTAQFSSDYNKSGSGTFSASTGTVVIPQGASSVSINVDPSIDVIPEDDETVAITITSSPSYAVGSSDSAVGTIEDDDSVEVSVAVSPLTVQEDGAQNLLFTFQRTGSLANSLTANFAVGGLATYAIDYTQTGAASFNAAAGSVTFPAGSNTAVITVNPTSDLSLEEDETVTLVVINGANYTPGASYSATGTIIDDDPEISVSVTPASVAEDGSTNMVYRFTRIGSLTNALTVQFAVSGTAAFGSDYSQVGAGSFSSSTGSVNLPAGFSSTTVVIDPTADIITEPDETVICTVLAGAGYRVGAPSLATGTITNDDGGGAGVSIVSVAAAPLSVTENGTPNLIYTFTRTPPVQNALEVAFSVGGTAAFVYDYSPLNVISYSNTSGVVAFAAGSSTAVVTINPSADSAVEPDESVILTVLPNGTAYTVGSPSTATGVISNDDVGLPEIGVEHSSGTALTDAVGNVNYGNVSATGLTKTFTIRNTGAVDLTGIAVTKDGPYSSDFTLDTGGMNSVVAAGASTTFSVKFAPQATGVRTASLHIASNDADENPFDIALAGTGTTFNLIANFTSETTVPLTVPSFTASGNAIYLTLSYAPAVGSTLTVVKVTGLGFIQGEFSNLTQGQLVTLTYSGTSYAFVADYYGGTGNDLVLRWANTRAWGWGENGSSQMGDGGAITDRLLPTPVSVTGLLAGKTIMALAPGPSHCVALCSDGTVAVWGSDSSGRLGRGPVLSSSSTPVSVDTSGVLTGRRVISISSGLAHSLALCADGAVVAWGRNYDGELGIGGASIGTDTSGNPIYADEQSPVLVNTTGALAGKTVAVLQASYAHSLALCTDGTLYAWGNGGDGRLGNGTNNIDGPIPAAVSTSGALAGKTVVAVAGAGEHNLALCSDGTVVAWGEGGQGRLGTGNEADSYVPVNITNQGVLATRTVVALSAGMQHSLALCSDGTVAAWGVNANGQLGNNSTAFSTVPVAINNFGALAGKTVVSVSAGHSHSVANCSDGSVVAWGNNASGQIGDGTTTERWVPTFVNSSSLPSAHRIASAFTSQRAEHTVALVAGPTPEPEIAVEAPVGNEHFVQGNHAMGQVQVGSSASLEFTIRNTGTGDLSGLAVIKTPASATAFTVDTTGMTTTVPASGSTTFTVQFAPSATGSTSVTLQIASNDANENPFVIALNGTGVTSSGPGSVDTSFVANSDGQLEAVALQPDGRVLVGGDFNQIAGTVRHNAARLNTDGSMDAGFNPDINGSVSSVLTQDDGKMVFSGEFYEVRGLPQEATVRFTSGGSLDSGFAPNPQGMIYASALTAEGKIVMGGNFVEIGGLARSGLARLTSAGVVDAAFQQDTDFVWAMVPQADGKVLVGGWFNSVGGVARQRLARINANGTLDTGFAPNISDSVFAIAVQADGKILVGGMFSTVDAVPRTHLARLHSDGSLDTTFNPVIDEHVRDIAVQADGKIIITGGFGTVQESERLRVARLLPNGTLDTSFNAACDGAEVRAISLRKDGKALIAGWFSSAGGLPRGGIAQLMNDPATESLSITSSSRIQWMRGGSAPEVSEVRFDVSTDGGTNWTTLGNATRITGGWEKTGLSLPSAGQIRARARIHSSHASSLIETVAVIVPVTAEIDVQQPAGTALVDGVSSIGFGSQPAFTSSTAKAFVINNEGGAPLSISSVSLVGGQAAEFSLNASSMLTTVPSGGSTGFTVSFSPISGGAKSTTLRLVSNDSDEGTFDVALTGTGISTSPGSIAFTSALTLVNEESGTANIAISRLGGSDNAVSVRVNSVPVTASSADFGALVNVLVDFAAGETTKSVPVTILADSLSEANESFTLALSNPTGGAVVATPSSTTVRIIDFIDTTAPTAAITAPVSGASINEGAFVITGTAADNKGVQRVEYSLNGSAFTSATCSIATNGLSATWSAPSPPEPMPGSNSLVVRSFDTRNNSSALVTRNFNYMVQRPLMVSLSGPANSGTLTAPFPGTDSTKKVGYRYTISATARTGYVFNGWTANGVNGTGITPAMLANSSLTFTHQEGLEITANFIANPFVTAITGNYSGIVWPSSTQPVPNGSAPSHENTGHLTIAVTGTGSFTGTLKVDGLSLPVAGVFDNAGVARFGATKATSFTLMRASKPDLELSLQLDMNPLGSTEVTGTLVQRLRSLIKFVSVMSLSRHHYNGMSVKVSPVLAGTASQRYTLILPAMEDQFTAYFTPADFPQGTGYATGTLSTAGAMVIAGRLADHTVFSASGSLSKTDQFSLFSTLYALKGCIAGTITVDPSLADSDLHTDGLLWFRPYQNTQWYRFGWDEGLSVSCYGARYTPPPAALLPNLSAPDASLGNAAITFEAGLLPTSITRNVNLASGMAKAPATDASFTTALTPSTGLFSGTFLHSDGTRPAYQGVLFQKTGVLAGGHGYFMSTQPRVIDYLGESGRMTLLAK